MKKYIIIPVLLLYHLNYSQVVLKGFEIGGYSTQNEKVTTVGGLPGMIKVDKMKNGKIWKITFLSSKSYRSDENKFDRVEFYNDLRELVSGIEENYMLSFNKENLTLENIIEIRDLRFPVTKNGVEYIIKTDAEIRNYNEWICFSMRSIRLDQVNRNENPNKHDY